MNSLLFGISISALFSVTSLLIVLMRVSPLTAPAQAVPAFFISLFMAVSTVGTLLLYNMWKYVPLHTWDMGRLLSISIRQGVLLGFGVVTLFLFHLLALLNWWISVMIFGVFILVELALEH